MADIRFDTGLKKFNINGATEVCFAPTDMNFIEKVYSAMERLDEKQGEYKDIFATAKDTEIFDLVRRMDADARAEINSIFETDICTPVFGQMNLFTVAEGLPVWANFILALIDELDGAFAEEKKKTNPRIQKYTAKYKR